VIRSGSKSSKPWAWEEAIGTSAEMVNPMLQLLALKLGVHVLSNVDKIFDENICMGKEDRSTSTSKTEGKNWSRIEDTLPTKFRI
jgi:hypothetical protein